ncbi:hypothetical protein WICPIJ_008703, partial [Wickerhamomyces pijperi]
MSLSDDEALFEDLYGDEEETKVSSSSTDETKAKEEVTVPAVKKEEATAEVKKEEPSTSSVTIDKESSTPLAALAAPSTPAAPSGPAPASAATSSASSYPPQPTTSISTSEQTNTAPRRADLSRDAGKMFVGGLDWDTSEERFRSYFSKYGEVIDYTIMRDANGRSRGFGFLTFTTKKSVDEVLKTQHILDGKVIDPKRAIPREEQDKTGKIFVGGIAPEVRPHEFESFFSQFGEIIDAQLMLDKDTGKSRGFGFVTFDSPEAVDKVCVGRYLEFNGRQIEVKRAEPRGPQQQQNHIISQQQRLMNGGNAYGRPNNNYYNNNNSHNNTQAQAPAGAAGAATPEQIATYWSQMQQYWAQVQAAG